MKVYLDNGATTKVADEVLKDMNIYFNDDYGNASSLHTFGQNAREAVEESREIIAKSIGANTGEIIFTSGGTESDNLAIIGYCNANEGNHIITTKIEHPAVYNGFKYLEKKGYQVDYLDVDKEGFVDIEQLKKLITEKTCLVSVMHANNEIGVIQDIAKIGKICKENKVAFHTDAVQSFTKVPIDVNEMNIDLLSMSSHKIHGPKGIGALYIRNGIRLEPLFQGGAHEFKKRPGTENVPGIVGFAKAISLIKKSDIERMQNLRDHLIEELLKLPDTWLNGPKERLCNNANISFNFIEGEGLLMHLDLLGISVSTGSACSSHSLEPSHVLLALGMKHEEAHGSIRFTLSKYTTKEEIDYTIKKVNEVVDKLRKMSPLVK